MTQQPRKKVLYLITKSNWGGAQRYVYDLATNLDRSKFEPVVALGGNGALADMLQNANIRVIKLTQMQNTTSLKQAVRAFKELLGVVRTEAPEVLHLNSSIAGLVGAIAGRIARVNNIIFTAHGWAFNEDRPLWQRLIIKSLHYLTVLLSHRTIAVSSAIVTQMNWPGAQRRMKIINPGRTIGPMYDHDEARAKILDFCPALTAFASDTWIVCVAELHPIKRHHIIIDAMSELIKTKPHTKLILIGEGKQKNILEIQVAELGLTNDVFLLGNIIEAARFLKAFDIFVLASKSESYGYVLHEAGLASVPIIATNVGGIPDIVTNQHTGLLVSPLATSNDFMNAISIYLDTPSQATAFAVRLKEELAERTVIKMALQTSSFYLLK